jgi:hypothetical protein
MTTLDCRDPVTRPRLAGNPEGRRRSAILVIVPSELRSITPRRRILRGIRASAERGNRVMQASPEGVGTRTRPRLSVTTVRFEERAKQVRYRQPGPVSEFAGGWVGFADDGIVSESLVGGAARWYLFPRISAGPEVLYIHGHNHSHLLMTDNLTFDVLGPINRRPRSVTPFVAGGGVFQTRKSLFTGTFTSSEGIVFRAGGAGEMTREQSDHEIL